MSGPSPTSDNPCIRNIWVRNSENPLDFISEEGLKAGLDLPAKGVKFHVLVQVQDEEAKGTLERYDSHGRLDKLEDSPCEYIHMNAFSKVECSECSIITTRCQQAIPPGALLKVGQPRTMDCC